MIAVMIRVKHACSSCLQALDPRTCSSHRCSINWSSLGRKVLHLCRYVSLLDPRRVEPIGLQLLDAVFCASPLQEGLASRAEKLTVGVANPSHSRVVAALQMPLLRDPIDVSPACQLSSKEPAESSCDKDYLLYLEDVLHRLSTREERRSIIGGGATSEADLVLSRRAMELTVTSIVNFFSARIFSYGCEGIDGSSWEEKELLEMLFDSRAVYGRVEACPVSNRGAVLFAAFSQEHSWLSAGVKTRLLRLCGCALTNQRWVSQRQHRTLLECG